MHSDFGVGLTRRHADKSRQEDRGRALGGTGSGGLPGTLLQTGALRLGVGRVCWRSRRCDVRRDEQQRHSDEDHR